jgi:hypothetical protein
MSCEYVRQYYKVPAEIGRRVSVYGKSGIITADRGHYIGVTLDSEKPNRVSNYHPTDQVVYLGMGKIRPMTRSQQRYARYRECADCFNSFRDFLRWDSAQSLSA